MARPFLRVTELMLRSRADANRPKTDSERRERTLESKRRWARKNRALQRARAAGLPEPTDDDFDEQGYPLPGRLGAAPTMSRASSVFSDSQPPSATAAYFDVPVVEEPQAYAQAAPPMRRAVSANPETGPHRAPLHRVASAPMAIDGMGWHHSPQRGSNPFLMPLPPMPGRSPAASYKSGDLDVFSGPLSAPLFPSSPHSPFFANLTAHSPARAASVGPLDTPGRAALAMPGVGTYYGHDPSLANELPPRPASAGPTSSPRRSVGLREPIRVSPARASRGEEEDVKPNVEGMDRGASSEEAAMQLLALKSSSPTRGPPPMGDFDAEDSFISKASTDFSFQLPAQDDGSSPPTTSPPAGPGKRPASVEHALRTSKRARPAHLNLDTPIRDPLLPLSGSQGGISVPLSSPVGDSLPPPLSSASRWPMAGGPASSSSAFASTPYHLYRASPPGAGGVSGFLFSSPGNPDMSRSLGLAPDAPPMMSFGGFGTPAMGGNGAGGAGKGFMSSPTKWGAAMYEHALGYRERSMSGGEEAGVGAGGANENGL